MSGTSSNMTNLFVIMTIGFVIVKNDIDIGINRKIPGGKHGRYEQVYLLIGIRANGRLWRRDSKRLCHSSVRC
jgi:hypothetical protein